MLNPTKITCPRCNGSGHFSFNLVKGTVCFGCDGAGFKVVDGKKHAAAVARKTKRDEAKKAEIAARVAKANELYYARQATYANDPRIGPQTRARCARFEAVADEIYRSLDAFDNNGLKVHDSFFDNIRA